MKIICKQNCSGKTKELIRESLDTNTPILVFSDRKRYSLEEKAIVYFQERVKTITLEEAKNYSGNVMIDDIDKNLSTLLKYAIGNDNIDIGAITLSA